MKLLISTLALFFACGTLAMSKESKPSNNTLNVENKAISWQAIEYYINTYAIKSDPIVIEALHTEARLGIRTWSLNLFGTASTVRDGGSVGWPEANKLICFATSAQAITCADMIDDFTLWQPRQK